MILHVLRAMFILLMAAVGWVFIIQPPANQPFGDATWLTLGISLSVGVLIVCADILAPRKKLAIFSGTFLGLLVGILIAYALSFLIQFLFDQTVEAAGIHVSSLAKPNILKFIQLVVGVACCYLAISFVLQTKDDFRFVIPYVEFSKQTKGARPMLIDTSVLIDGRIADVAGTGMMESQLIVPRFVLDELQLIADSSDKLKRARGRRGLDMLTRLRDSKKVEVVLYDSSVHDESDSPGVDQKLVTLAKHLNARVLTTDFNLNKVAQLRGIDVINLNDLGNALRPVMLPGEKMTVRLVGRGEEDGQGVGYLEDGTMVVVEQGQKHIDEAVEFTVNRVIQTSAGRMIFGRLGEAPPPAAPRGRREETRGGGKETRRRGEEEKRRGDEIGGS